MKTRYVYFPTVKKPSVKFQKECHSIEETFAYLFSCYSRGAEFTVYVYDRKTDRDVLQPGYRKFRSQRDFFNGVILCLLTKFRCAAYRNASKGVQLPY